MNHPPTLLLSALAAAVITPTDALARAACEPTESQKLLAADGDGGDRFGIYVAIDGDLAISGAYLDEPIAASSGSAYVFRRLAEGAWVQDEKLVPDDGGMGDWFGVSVAIDGDFALVGAQLDDDNGNDAGAAYIFHRVKGVWMQEDKLLADDGEASDWMGHSVSLDGDAAIVSAQLNDEAAPDAGAAYVFRRQTDGAWIQEAKLIAADAAAGDEFATSVAIDGDVAVVGARWADPAGSQSGAAWVFRRQPEGTWIEEATLLADDLASGDEFGFAVAIDGDTVAVGARLEDEAGENAGAMYVFQDVSGAWTQQVKLVPTGLGPDDRLGESVSLRGDVLVAGARQDDEAAPEAGAAWVFQRIGGVWTEQGRVTSSDAEEMDFFGISVGTDGERAIIGANLDGDLGLQAGSAYIFDLNCETDIPGDIDGDGSVGFNDLLILLAAWGPCPAPPEECPADLDGSGEVGFNDLLIVLTGWTG